MPAHAPNGRRRGQTRSRATTTRYATDARLSFSTDDVRFTVGWTLARTREHKAIIAEKGWGSLIYYEGGDHDDLDIGLRNIPGMAQFFRDWKASRQAGELRRRVDTALINETPGTMIADYSLISPDRPNVIERPWGERAWRETTPTWEAIQERLRPARSNSDA